MDQQFIDQLAEKLSKLGTKRPLGFHYAHPFGTVPPDSIQCNGATYNRALYADFFAYATEQGWVKTESEWQSIASANGGYCPYYSDGDGSTTFRTPKFAPFMQIAIASGNVGNYHSAGVPNITGEISGIEGSATVAKGAFYLSTTNGVGSGDSDYDNKQIKFDASRESEIFGNSETVQPESTEWMICVVVMGVATNVGSADVGDVMSAVAQVQAAVGAIPTPNAYITQTWKSGSSWYHVWSNGLIEQGGVKSVASSNDKLTLNKSFTNSNYFFTGTPDSTKDDTASWSVRMKKGTKTTTSVNICVTWGSGYIIDSTVYWYACGY